MADRWTAPTGYAQVRYDSPPPWDDGAHCAAALTPGVQVLADAIRRDFPTVTKFGGLFCRQNTANPSETSTHGTGRALDVFPTSVAQGDAIASWAVRHAERYQIQYVIYRRGFWGAGKAGEYHGPNPHEDHVHIEVNEAGAAQGGALVAQRPVPSSGGSGIGLGILIALGILYAGG